MNTGPVHRPVCCLRPGFHWYSMCLPTEGWQAELTWVAGYIPTWFARPKKVTDPGNNGVRRRVISLNGTDATNALPQRRSKPPPYDTRTLCK